MPPSSAALLVETVPALMHAIRRGARAARGSGLTVPQIRVLGHVDRHDGASLSDVAAHLGLSMPGTSQLVEGLVERRLLRRQEDSDDRRRIRLGVTAAGKAQVADARAGARAAVERIVARLEPAELAMLEGALAALRRALAAEVPE
jgi:DNA-binding MarR family transcriptional regulator